MKVFKGKAIYQPAGAAGEYAGYACNFYRGCSCGCHYCYNKTKRFKAVLGGDTPILKKSFKDEEHALEVFEKELKANLPELQKRGLFFSITTDPMLPETMNLTLRAMQLCCMANVPVKILTKCTDFAYCVGEINNQKVSFAQLFVLFKANIAVGFTLTGCDELEPNASTNAERIEAMRKLHEAGFKTWASIEPIIDFDISGVMIDFCMAFCDMFKIGLMSGKKYDKKVVSDFISHILHKINLTDFNGPRSPHYNKHGKPKIYFKDGLLKQAGISRSELPDNCVDRDYNIFNT